MKNVPKVNLSFSNNEWKVKEQDVTTKMQMSVEEKNNWQLETLDSQIDLQQIDKRL